MAEEDKKVEDVKDDAAHADADAGEKLDKVLSALDSLSRRMDAMEEEDRKKADAAKADAEKCEAKADEGKDGPHEEDDKAKEVAADKARKDSEEEKAKADAEEKEREERAKADADIARRIADVERKLPRQMTDAEYESMADAQARADSVFAAYGKRAPRPLDGESEVTYRRRLAREIQKNTKGFKSFDFSGLAGKSFEQIEGMIYADAMEMAAHPEDLAAGELRAITTTETSGHRVTRFVGKSSFVNQFKPPVAKLVSEMPLVKASRAG